MQFHKVLNIVVGNGVPLTLKNSFYLLIKTAHFIDGKRFLEDVVFCVSVHQLQQLVVLCGEVVFELVDQVFLLLLYQVKKTLVHQAAFLLRSEVGQTRIHCPASFQGLFTELGYFDQAF